MADDPGRSSQRRSLGSTGHDGETQQLIAPGQTLAGKYKVLELLGAGAMGMVFKVEDLNLDGRVFAIKVLPPELARNESSVMRLKKEALSAIDLHHSNIMAVNAFEADGANYFLVMEYLDGPDLEKALARKERFTVDEMLDVARQVCPALAYAHGRNIVHRDIKPANLLYKTEGDRKVIKVADFGIAYQIKDSMTRLTGTEAAGTLLYVAPEQLKGDRPSAASDQYSLAATLYELLRGEPPFVGTALTHQVLNAQPRPIADAPGHVNSALLRALSKEPQDRYPDCNALLTAMDAQMAAPEVEPCALPEFVPEPPALEPPPAGLVPPSRAHTGALAAREPTATPLSSLAQRDSVPVPQNFGGSGLVPLQTPAADGFLKTCVVRAAFLIARAAYLFTIALVCIGVFLLVIKIAGPGAASSPTAPSRSSPDRASSASPETGVPSRPAPRAVTRTPAPAPRGAPSYATPAPRVARPTPIPTPRLDDPRLLALVGVRDLKMAVTSDGRIGVFGKVENHSSQTMKKIGLAFVVPADTREKAVHQRIVVNELSPGQCTDVGFVIAGQVGSPSTPQRIERFQVTATSCAPSAIGLRVNPGDILAVWATGAWTLGPLQGSCGPTGQPGTTSWSRNPQAWPTGCLLIGANNSYAKYTGEPTAFQCSSVDVVNFEVNDSAPGNNRGALSLTVAFNVPGVTASGIKFALAPVLVEF